MTRATVVVCAHNEESYIRDCLLSIRRQTRNPELVIVVADRCTDRTIEIAKRELDPARSLIIDKAFAKWKNSISENLHLAMGHTKGDAFVVVDADITLPGEFLEILLPQLGDCAVVSAVVKTDPSRGSLNMLVALWERTYRFTPLGEQPRGGARAIAIKPLESVGGFRDVYAWESDLDTRLRKAGFKTRLERRLSVLQRRRMTLAHSVAYQIQAGRARRELGVSSLRTVLHSIVRLRPFVMVGYFGGSSRRGS